MIRRPPRSTLFPYTRRCRSSGTVDEGNLTAVTDSYGSGNDSGTTSTSGSLTNVVHFGADGPHQTLGVNDGYQFTVIDRESTRLNSTHQISSHAVFVFNKKQT